MFSTLGPFHGQAVLGWRHAGGYGMEVMNKLNRYIR